MYAGKDIEGIPSVIGVYSLIREVPKQQKHREWIYTGMSGNLKTRVGEHLKEQTGTYSGNKNAASLNLERLTNVRWWNLSNLEWPNDVENRYINKKGEHVKVDIENKKEWVLAIAGGAEIIIKRRFPPMLDDQSKPKGMALELSKSHDFISKIENIMEDYSELELPSQENLHRKIKELEMRILNLEERFDQKS